ncbi:hypothetical protein B0H11DRAFT_1939765 [Mycena galericulata]|nr:hypothetical protein B0H11DRAFT_1939765 [Mycena galericulata]
MTYVDDRPRGFGCWQIYRSTGTGLSIIEKSKKEKNTKRKHAATRALTFTHYSTSASTSLCSLTPFPSSASGYNGKQGDPFVLIPIPPTSPAFHRGLALDPQLPAVEIHSALVAPAATPARRLCLYPHACQGWGWGSGDAAAGSARPRGCVCGAAGGSRSAFLEDWGYASWRSCAAGASGCGYATKGKARGGEGVSAGCDCRADGACCRACRAAVA